MAVAKNNGENSLGETGPVPSSRADECQRGTTLMIALSASKSDGLRVYRGRLLAAAVEAMSKSASRGRLNGPAARAGANMRPYMRAASPSNGLSNLAPRRGSSTLNVHSPSRTDWQGAVPLPASRTIPRYFEFPAVTIGDVTPYSVAIWMPFRLI